MSQPATTDRIISGVLESFGRIDTLINNAGVFISKPFTATKALAIEYASRGMALYIGVSDRLRGLLVIVRWKARPLHS